MKVYADHAATTPMRERAKAAMIECLEEYGNPSSIHAAGRLAAMKLESARKEVAELLNCRPAEIYFTSGGTEADNWAIRAARYGAGREACENMTTAAEYTRRLRDKLVDRILEIPGANINGSMNNRLPGNINCRFDGVEGEAVVIMLDLAGVCVSAGSACTSGSGEPSHVLTAMGQTRRDAYGAIRITLAETNTEAEVEYIADQLAAIVKDLRRK